MEDSALIGLWLGSVASQSPHTERAYRSALERLRRHLDKPLTEATLGDLEGFAHSLGHLAPASQARIISAIRSFFGFAASEGYLGKDPSLRLRVPKTPARLANRILSEEETLRLLLAADAMGKEASALVRLLYLSGLRVSEAVSLRWGDLQPREDGAFWLTVASGKGSKTRTLLLPATLWERLGPLRRDGPDAFVFPARQGEGHMTTYAAWRIVREAARQAGLSRPVSPHWLRHAHASHALERGCPVSVLQADLGHASLNTTSRYVHARPGSASAEYLPS